MRTVAFAAVIAVLLAGCTALPSPESASFSAPAPKPGFAAVYVGRPSGWDVSFVPLIVNLDERPLAELGPGRYTRIELRPGTYQLAAPNTFRTRATYGVPHPVELKIEAGKAYFALPKRWAEDVRPQLLVVGRTVVAETTATRHASFSVETRAPTAEVPSAFPQLSYVAPDAGFVAQ